MANIEALVKELADASKFLSARAALITPGTSADRVALSLTNGIAAKIGSLKDLPPSDALTLHQAVSSGEFGPYADSLMTAVDDRVAGAVDTTSSQSDGSFLMEGISNYPSKSEWDNMLKS